MRLYEVYIGSTWWVAADDEPEAMGVLRTALFDREVSDEEMDSVMEDLRITEATKYDAGAIEVGYDCESVWSLFSGMVMPGVVYTDFIPEDDPDEYDAYEEVTKGLWDD